MEAEAAGFSITLFITLIYCLLFILIALRGQESAADLREDFSFIHHHDHRAACSHFHFVLGIGNK